MAEVKKTTAPKTAPVKTAAPKKAVVKTVAKKAPVKSTPKPVAATSLPKSVFGVKPNTQAIFDTIMSERASVRQGTHKVKNKGEVSGTGKKPWAQKGTGRARAASLRSNVFVGGGVAFGPTTERNYNLKVNKKVRKLALFSALSIKAADSEILENEIKLSKIKTQDLLAELKKLNLDGKKVLIVTEDEKIFRSAKNIKKVKTVKVNSLSVESVVHADYIVMSKEQIKKLEGMVK